MYSKVKYDYDGKADSLFIYSVEDYNYDVSLDLSDNIVLDFDKTQKVVAFEFLDASNLFNISKKDFKHIHSINIQLKITWDKIELNIVVEVVVHDKTHQFGINWIMSNISNIPKYCSQLAC